MIGSDAPAGAGCLGDGGEPPPLVAAPCHIRAHMQPRKVTNGRISRGTDAFRSPALPLRCLMARSLSGNLAIIRFWGNSAIREGHSSHITYMQIAFGSLYARLSRCNNGRCIATRRERFATACSCKHRTQRMD
ncbi:hypothetical protein TcasGA2_TC003683 [Tribolium castaneum]|uniref:Uncharacterized protein n=1 Tax=Tribolium castaneum TaxID=7070 RepID=D6WDL8_TRICA|nr:hypothetical protein TcasGA2_TC003683 [Tribolium castaneum]